jgi:NADH-quinone oxidoreductase subunit H
MPEAEQELTAGYHTEYSGMKFALFFMAEYIKMIAVSAIGATLYFGGYSFPWIDTLPVVGPYLGPVVLFLKVFLLVGGMIWVRATLPRIRYDRLMAFGWKILLPLALITVIITAGGVVLQEAVDSLYIWIVPVLSMGAFFLVFWITQRRTESTRAEITRLR